MPAYVLEQTVRKPTQENQHAFAAEAAPLLADCAGITCQCTDRGLVLLAQAEAPLTAALARLRAKYDAALEVLAPRVRYRDHPQPAEPIMKVTIGVPDSFLQLIHANLLFRRAEIVSVEAAGGKAAIDAVAPLAELLGYASELSLLSNATASLDIAFSHYAPLGRPSDGSFPTGLQ